MLDTTRVLVSSKLKTYPSVFLPIAHVRENSKRRVVRRDSDIAIEGYWRCGNHFATYAFMVAQARDVSVAHHFHAPAQLVLALRWNVPAVLLIRDPLHAVTSATVFLNKEDPRPFLKFYNTFHGALIDHAARLVISDFPRTVNDFGSVIDEVNRRCGKRFRRFDDTQEQRREVERRIRREHETNMGARSSTLPLPSDEKDALKARVLERLHAPQCAGLLGEAQALYAALVDASNDSAAPSNAVTESAQSDTP